MGASAGASGPARSGQQGSTFDRYALVVILPAEIVIGSQL